MMMMIMSHSSLMHCTTGGGGKGVKKGMEKDIWKKRKSKGRRERGEKGL